MPPYNASPTNKASEGNDIWLVDWLFCAIHCDWQSEIGRDCLTIRSADIILNTVAMIPQTLDLLMWVSNTVMIVLTLNLLLILTNSVICLEQCAKRRLKKLPDSPWHKFIFFLNIYVIPELGYLSETFSQSWINWPLASKLSKFN